MEFKKKGYFINSISASKSYKNSQKQNIIDVLRNQYHIKADSIVFKNQHEND